MPYLLGSQSVRKWQQAFTSGEIALQVSPSVLASYQNDQGVLLDYERDHYYGLNVLAASVWTMLSASRSFSEIIDAVTRSHDVSAAVASRDIAGLVGELLALELVRVCKTAP